MNGNTFQNLNNNTTTEACIAGTISLENLFATVCEALERGTRECYEKAMEAYIQNLRNFRCEHDKRGRLVPFRLQQLVRIEEEMDDYIREYSKLMPDDTWRNFAWRTKLNALKKIIVLYIANGGKWEESFEPFCWWSFYYAMWVKMNLFYEKASEAFGEENIVANVWTRSPLELVSEEFTRKQIYEAFRQCGRTSPGASLLNYYEKHGVVKRVGKDEFKKLK